MTDFLTKNENFTDFSTRKRNFTCFFDEKMRFGGKNMTRDEILKKLSAAKRRRDKAENEYQKMRKEVISWGQGYYETENYSMTISFQPRESFKLRDALTVLDRRQLAPFITSYETIRVQVKSGKLDEKIKKVYKSTAKQIEAKIKKLTQLGNRKIKS